VWTELEREASRERDDTRLRGGPVSAARVVDEDVEAAEVSRDLLRRRGRLRLVRHVRREAEGTGSELLGGALGCFTVDVEQRYSRSLFREALRDPLSDSTRATRHDRYLVLQPHLHLLLSSAPAIPLQPVDAASGVASARAL
jgi:hypothetical protein